MWQGVPDVLFYIVVCCVPLIICFIIWCIDQFSIKYSVMDTDLERRLRNEKEQRANFSREWALEQHNLLQVILNDQEPTSIRVHAFNVLDDSLAGTHSHDHRDGRWPKIALYTKALELAAANNCDARNTISAIVHWKARGF